MSKFKCRFCDHDKSWSMVDLGEQPLANSYLKDKAAIHTEKHYPLHARVCSRCYLAQVDIVVPREDIFSEYAYFSSYSASWVDHARRYCEMVVKRFDLGPDNLVIEIASNDGYLLHHFRPHGIPVMGIEPAANIAEVANQEGIRTINRFFGLRTAEALRAEGYEADLLIGNNVLAHVPDINDFVSGLPVLLARGGLLTMEFHHLLNLIRERQFDTVYHEHFSYLSLITTQRIFERHGLRLFDVESLSTHGGSLRVYAERIDNPDPRPEENAVSKIIEIERELSLTKRATYKDFESSVREVRAKLLAFLGSCRRDGKSVVAYGAAAKGNTLLNYCGINQDSIDYVVDRSPHKQNHYLPGSHLAIRPPEAIRETRPDYVLILPWNLADEISGEHAYISEWGGRFVVPIPEIKMVS